MPVTGRHITRHKSPGIRGGIMASWFYLELVSTMPDIEIHDVVMSYKQAVLNVLHKQIYTDIFERQVYLSENEKNVSLEHEEKPVLVEVSDPL